MITSQETGEIAAAMAKAQEKIENPTKHKTAKVKSDKGNYDYMYTDLAAGLECIRPALSGQEIAVFQVPTIDRNGNVILITRLIHSSGQWVEGDYFVCGPNLDHQKKGSALTYSRRQSLFAMVGIAGADDDDDGKAASSNGNDSGGDPAPVMVGIAGADDDDDGKAASSNGNDSGGDPAPVTNAQAQLIRDKIASTNADLAKFLAFFKVESVGVLRSSQFREAMNLLSAKKTSAKEPL